MDEKCVICPPVVVCEENSIINRLYSIDEICEAIKFAAFILSDKYQKGIKLEDNQIDNLLVWFVNSMFEKGITDKKIGNCLMRHYFAFIPFIEKFPNAKMFIKNAISNK